ncbi:MAG: alpha/beta hydrolase [Alteromonadaceae bacterium]|nr:alpha/beta hydrolase [Alteromonadaceae bacterium]
MKNIKVIFVMILVSLIYGCTETPLLTITKQDVGMVLQPISQSNIIDSRAEFRQLFCAINDDHGETLPDYQDCNVSLHKLSDEPEPVNKPKEPHNSSFQHKLKILLVPGIFGECLIDEVSPFSYAIEHLQKAYKIDISVLPGIRGRASSKHNSAIIHDFIKKLDNKKQDEKLILVGYSKGTTDLLYYLSVNEYKSSWDNIDALVGIAGVVNGTPLADDANSFLKKLAEIFPFDKCPTQQGESGIEDITRENQLFRLSKQKLPESIQYFSLAPYVNENNISSIMNTSYQRLSLVDPRNDGQVIYYDAIIPGSHLLGYANADHWAIALPFSRHIDSLSFINKTIAKQSDKNAYPREVLLESIVRFVDMKLVENK